MTSGLFAVIAILGALEARRRDGQGCHVDLGIADVAMPLQLFQLAAIDVTVPQPESTYLNGGAAYYRVYTTRDARHVMLGAVEPKFWRAFCEAADQPDWIPRQQEKLPQIALIRDLAAQFARLTLQECEACFGMADCCVSPVLDLAEEEVVVCGMALGYADRDAPENTLETVRAPARDFMRFEGFGRE